MKGVLRQSMCGTEIRPPPNVGFIILLSRSPFRNLSLQTQKTHFLLFTFLFFLLLSLGKEARKKARTPDPAFVFIHSVLLLLILTLVFLDSVFWSGKKKRVEGKKTGSIKYPVLLVQSSIRKKEKK